MSNVCWESPPVNRCVGVSCFELTAVIQSEDRYKCHIEHDFAKQSLLFSIPETISNCAINIKEKLTTHSIEGMSMYAKNFLLTYYNLECNIADCYVCVHAIYCYIAFFLRARGVGAMLAQCWHAVYDVGPTCIQQSVGVSYSLGMCINV